MERHELRELVEDALEALKTRYQRTRTPFNLQTIREEVEDQHGPLADDDAAQIPGIMQRLCGAGAWSRRRAAAVRQYAAVRLARSMIAAPARRPCAGDAATSPGSVGQAAAPSRRCFGRMPAPPCCQ
jgi:hypothetical protein